jgi:hypothetical protein
VSRSHTTYQKRGITVQGEEKGEGVGFLPLVEAAVWLCQ